jgi:hypothetical protein
MRSALLRGFLLWTLLALLPFCPGNAQPPEKPEKSAAVEYEKVAGGGPGVSGVVRDEQGRIRSVLVVGRSRISTVLGAAKGKEVALQRASLAADVEFVKWLGSKVEVHESLSKETTLFLEGEDNDPGALRESGKAVEKTSAQYKRLSSGFVRGLQTVYRHVDGTRKELTLVKRWSARRALAIEKLGGGQDKPASRPTRALDDRTIEDEKVTIKE